MTFQLENVQTNEYPHFDTVWPPLWKILATQVFHCFWHVVSLYFLAALKLTLEKESRNIKMILETLFNISGWKFLLLCVFVQLLLTWLLYKVVEERLSPLQKIPVLQVACRWSVILSLLIALEDFLKWFVFGLNSTPLCLSCIQDLDLALVGNYTINNDWDWLLLVGRFLEVKSLAEISMLQGSYLIRNEPF